MPEAPTPTFPTAHPFAEGIDVTEGDVTEGDVTEGDGEPVVVPPAREWPLATEPGEHVARVRLRTRYGSRPAGEVRYVVTRT